MEDLLHAKSELRTNVCKARVELSELHVSGNHKLGETHRQTCCSMEWLEHLIDMLVGLESMSNKSELVCYLPTQIDLSWKPPY